MFCIDWSAMSCRLTMLTDCGVSRSGVSVLVADDVRGVAYPDRFVAFALITTRPRFWAVESRRVVSCFDWRNDATRVEFGVEVVASAGLAAQMTAIATANNARMGRSFGLGA